MSLLHSTCIQTRPYAFSNRFPLLHCNGQKRTLAVQKPQVLGASIVAQGLAVQSGYQFGSQTQERANSQDFVSTCVTIFKKCSETFHRVSKFLMQIAFFTLVMIGLTGNKLAYAARAKPQPQAAAAAAVAVVEPAPTPATRNLGGIVFVTADKLTVPGVGFSVSLADVQKPEVLIPSAIVVLGIASLAMRTVSKPAAEASSAPPPTSKSKKDMDPQLAARIASTMEMTFPPSISQAINAAVKPPSFIPVQVAVAEKSLVLPPKEMITAAIQSLPPDLAQGVLDAYNNMAAQLEADKASKAAAEAASKRTKEEIARIAAEKSAKFAQEKAAKLAAVKAARLQAEQGSRLASRTGNGVAASSNRETPSIVVEIAPGMTDAQVAEYVESLPESLRAVVITAYKAQQASLAAPVPVSAAVKPVAASMNGNGPQTTSNASSHTSANPVSMSGSAELLSAAAGNLPPEVAKAVFAAFDTSSFESSKGEPVVANGVANGRAKGGQSPPPPKDLEMAMNCLPSVLQKAVNEAMDAQYPKERELVTASVSSGPRAAVAAPAEKAAVVASK